jgi:agmatinase
MLWSWATALALSASAAAHATHHAHGEEAFSQERLDELERKWGTDVGNALKLVCGLQLISR